MSSSLDPTPIPVSSSFDPTPSNLELPVVLHKGKCQCTYPISNFVSYNYLSPCFLLAFLDSISIPKTIQKALSHLGWRDTMLEKIYVLDKTGSQNLLDLYYLLVKRLLVANGYSPLKFIQMAW